MDHIPDDNARKKFPSQDKSLPARPYKQFHALPMPKGSGQDDPDLIVLDANGELWKRKCPSWSYPPRPVTWARLDKDI
jgi:hypothetical protein